MTGTIWLIAEDETDGDVVRAILSKRGIAARVRVRSPSTGGVHQLTIELEKLIQLIRQEKQDNDCIAVLHDADEHTQPVREPYDRIRSICRKHKHDVVLVVARNQIEAWILADSGIRRWLKGVKARSYDGEADSKAILKRLLQREQKMKYQGSDRDRVLDHLMGDGDQYSESMKKSLHHLDAAPCTQPETA